MTYTLSNELTDGEERLAKSLLGDKAEIVLPVRDAPRYWAMIALRRYTGNGVVVVRGLDSVLITREVAE